jgi:hypothetical protein
MKLVEEKVQLLIQDLQENIELIQKKTRIQFVEQRLKLQKLYSNL